MSTGQKRIALLIDADNAPAAKIDMILADIAIRGSATVRRAYGNWESPNLKRWSAVLDKHGIEAVQQDACSKGKNATDIAIVIDAMDLLHGGSVAAFALVSSDSDFTPLAMRLVSGGKNVYGFGEAKTPLPFVKACTKFRHVEQLVRPTSTSSVLVAKTAGKKPCLDEELIRRICSAVDAAKQKSGWAHLGEVGNQLAKEAPFRVKDHGHPNLLSLIEATKLFMVAKYPHVVRVRSNSRLAA